MNDFNFPEEDVIGKRHFEIKYDMQRDNYKIKNLFGSGLFVKITKKFVKLSKYITLTNYTKFHKNSYLGTILYFLSPLHISL